MGEPGLLERIRALFRHDRTHTAANHADHDAEHAAIRRRLLDQEHRLRLARIDAGLPADRRHTLRAQHPGRRLTDAHH